MTRLHRSHSVKVCAIECFMKVLVIHHCVVHFKIMDQTEGEVDCKLCTHAPARTLSSADEELIVKIFTARSEREAAYRITCTYEVPVCSTRYFQTILYGDYF